MTAAEIYHAILQYLCIIVKVSMYYICYNIYYDVGYLYKMTINFTTLKVIYRIRVTSAKFNSFNEVKNSQITILTAVLS